MHGRNHRQGIHVSRCLTIARDGATGVERAGSDGDALKVKAFG